MSISKPNLIVAPNAQELNQLILQKWIELGLSALNQKGIFSVALSGGKGPISFYQLLSGYKNKELWDKTHIFLVDERFVPLDHEDSNFHMIKTHLLDPVAIPENNLHPILTHHSNPEDSACEYEEELKSFFHLKTNQFPSFDFLMLGVGIDGHTASLFPGALALRESKRLALSVEPPPEIKHPRITITIPVINQAKFILVHVPGADKSQILFRILEKKENLPLNLVNPTPGQLVYYLNKESAALLNRNS